MFSAKEKSAFLQELGISEVETIAMPAARSGLVFVFPCAYIGVKNVNRFDKTKELFKKAGVTVVE